MIGMSETSDPKPSGAFFWTQEPWGRALRCSELPVPHLFTSSDVVLRDSEQEWNAVAVSLGVTRDRLLLVKQVHGVDVAVARRGATRDWSRPHADIVITDDPAVAIGVRVADCAPILLYDRGNNVAAAVHAGWRGTAARAAEAGVHALRREFGTNPANLVAAIGPCLGQCCGEVGPEVIDAFRSGGADQPSLDAWFTPGRGDRSLLDLERANHDQLAQAGVKPGAIFVCGLCTKTNPQRLHSYRAARDASGRMLAAIRVAGT
jgi:YfiH family protein